MIKICPSCSNVDIETLRDSLDDDIEIEETCIGQCGVEFVAYVDDKLIEAHDETTLIETIKSAID